uniref:AMP-binding domain-containing protein n=1 Tax=Angiostrongylus cantonensis TaxID=6313 RepID=A0A158PCA7_ANGCA
MIESDYPDVPLPEEPYHEILLKAIKQHIDNGKNKIAFVREDYRNFKLVTFKQVYDNAYSVAAFLHTKGFAKDVACAVIPNLWHYSAFFLGVALRGGAISGASSMFTEYELQRQFVDSHAKVVLTSEHFLEKVLKAIQGVIYIPESTDGHVPHGVVSWYDVVKTSPSTSIPRAMIDVDRDMVLLPYSSGTTGNPKGVMLTHRNFATMITLYMHETTNITPFLDANWDYEMEKIILFLPFYHVYGFGLINLTLLQGSTGIIFKYFEPVAFCKAIQDYKIHFLPVVPPIMVFLAKHPICGQYDLSSLKMLICGAAPAGKDICEELSKKYPNIKHIRQGYGMTECTMASHLPDLKNEVPFGSVGKVASNLRMKIVDPSTGKEMPTGMSGEICIKGPTVMLGYLGNLDATKATIINGWLHTGMIQKSHLDLTTIVRRKTVKCSALIIPLKIYHAFNSIRRNVQVAEYILGLYSNFKGPTDV